MDHLFHPLFTLHPSAESQLDAYLTSRQRELALIANHMPVAKGAACDLDYSSQLKNHIQIVISSIKLIHKQLDELIIYINEETLFPQKSFSFSGLTYYSHIDSKAYFLYSPIAYDSFLKKELFWVIELDAAEKEKKIHQSSIGFSDKNILSLLQYPIDLKFDLEKFEGLETIEASEKHVQYCRQRLLDYFEVEDVLALYEIEQSNLLKYIGDPLVLLRSIQKKHNDNRIKLSLQPSLPWPVNKATIELIHVERRVIKKDQLRNFWEEEQFTDYTKQLAQTKGKLMKVAGVSQEQLDRFIELLPADFL